MDPTNPLGLVLCSFFKRGDCMKGINCHFVHTDQVQRIRGHPWFPYFSYVKPPQHVRQPEKDVKVDIERLNSRLKVQSIKTLRFCKAYPACCEGKYCAFLHDQRIRMMMMLSGPPPPVASLKPLSPNAHPFSPRPPMKESLKMFVFPSQTQAIPNFIPSPTSSPLSSTTISSTTAISSTRIPLTPVPTPVATAITAAAPPPPNPFSMPVSMFSLYSQTNQYKSNPTKFEQHFQMASPLFSKKFQHL
jgi:hypothetical protein